MLHKSLNSFLGLQVALKSVLPECGKEGSLLRHVLQSAASADTSHKHIDPEQFQALCEDCSKVRGDTMQLLANSPCYITWQLCVIQMFAFLEKAGQTVSSPTNNIREAKKVWHQHSKLCCRDFMCCCWVHRQHLLTAVTELQIGLQMAPGVMQLLHASYGELDTNAASPQPHITDATAAFLKLARVALLSKE